MHKLVTANQLELGNTESSLNYVLRQNIPKGSKILDIGCNVGSLLENLRLEGYNNISGADTNKNALTNGRIIYPALKDKLFLSKNSKLPFKENTFDVILMFDLIEHLKNPDKYLSSQVFRVLKNGGQLIFQTPNKLINVPWVVFCDKSFSKYKKVHCSLQTLFSLRGLLEESGFENICIEKFNINTMYNRKKLQRKLGILSIPLLKIIQKLPLVLYSNFFGHCTKGKRKKQD